MRYKDLLVVLDANHSAGERIAVATELARRFDAHLVGLYVMLVPERPDSDDTAIYDVLWRDAWETAEREACRIREQFEEAARRQSLPAEWRVVSGYPGDMAALHGRYADLVIVGQLDPEDQYAALIGARPEEVALHVGRPVLVVPYAGNFAQVGRRVLIGWDASREATRAVNDALPLLVAASSVLVMTVDAKPGGITHGELPGADIALHLARHGVAVQVERTTSAGIGIGNTLLSRASDFEADLLVMGAYGHSRLREALLGGATRTALESMTLPVLMAH